MAGKFARGKRVTEPLDEKVKALLRCSSGVGDEWDDCRLLGSSGYTSGGIEHEGVSALSGHLHGLFFFFHIDEDGDFGRGGMEEPDDDKSGKGKDGFSPPTPAPPLVSPAEMVRDLMKVRGDRFRKGLVLAVTKAVDRSEALRESRPAFRRAVMTSLRDSGYNAGLCKAMREKSGGVAAGSHEYIDVVRSPEGGRRFIVDVGFAEEFEIARPTEEYKSVMEELPRVYVGRAEELKKAVMVVADAGERSLRAREMHVPPWRKARYLRNKWLGPYKRTTDPVPSVPTEEAVSPATIPTYNIV